MYCLELIYDYYMIYCPDMDIHEFKSLFHYDLTFEGNERLPVNSREEIEDEFHLHSNDIIKFYNDSMEYKYLQTTAKRVSINYTYLLAESLRNVEKKLEKLWDHYNLDLKNYLFNMPNYSEYTKTLFPRIGILTETRQYLKENKKINHAYFKNVKINFDSTSSKIFATYKCYVVDDKHNQTIVEYIFKSTEKILRDALYLEENFKLNAELLLEKYRDLLFKDNLENNIIYNEIKKSAQQTINRNKNLLDKIEIIKDIDNNDGTLLYQNQKININHIVNDLISISEESLEISKNILSINQNRLVIEDDQALNEEECDINNNKIENTFFDQTEISILNALLENNDKSLDEIEHNDNSLTQYFEKINEKALTLIDDVVVDNVSRCIFEEYKEDVRRWCKNEFE